MEHVPEVLLEGNIIFQVGGEYPEGRFEDHWIPVFHQVAGYSSFCMGIEKFVDSKINNF